MTLKELQAQVNALILENERRGWSDRNDLPLIIQTNTKTPTGQCRSSYTPVSYLSGSILGDSRNRDFNTLICYGTPAKNLSEMETE